jgi:hypothetical protein
MPPEQQQRLLGGALLDRAAHGTGPGHDLRRRAGLVAVDDDGGQARRERLDARGGLGRVEPFRRGVDQGHAVAAAGGEAGDQPGPHRGLDRAQPLAERLVDLPAIGRIDEHEIDGAGQRPPPRRPQYTLSARRAGR